MFSTPAFYAMTLIWVFCTVEVNINGFLVDSVPTVYLSDTNHEYIN